MNRRRRRKKKNKQLLIVMLSIVLLAVVSCIAIWYFTSEETEAPTPLGEPIDSHIESIEVSSPSNPVESGTVSDNNSSESTETLSENQIDEQTASTTSVSENDIVVDDNSEPEDESIPEIEIEEPIGTICLTFDDGPSLEITEQILDILSEKGIHATFFILDFQIGSEKEEIIRRILEEGHTIGLHGTSHDYSIIYASRENLYDNFYSLQQKLYESTGYESTLIRFPGGSSNTVSKKYCIGIMSEAVEYCNNEGIRYFDWNVDSDDAGSARSAEAIFTNVTTTLVPGRINVVLMHDSSGKIYTLEALPAIIDYALEQGYTFEAITDETPQVHHGVQN